MSTKMDVFGCGEWGTINPGRPDEEKGGEYA